MCVEIILKCGNIFLQLVADMTKPPSFSQAWCLQVMKNETWQIEEKRIIIIIVSTNHGICYNEL